MQTLGRHLNRPRNVVPLVAGVLVALVAGAVLTVGHHDARMAVAPRVAIAAALRDPAVARARAGSHWNQITATAIDNTLVHVSFLAHGQLVAEAAVNRHGQVLSAAQRPEHAGARTATGSRMSRRCSSAGVRCSC